MGLLLDLKDDVAWQDTGGLISLTLEINLVAAPDAPVNVDVEDLSLDDGLLAIAAFAPIFLADDLALAIAVRADGLETLDHGTHLPHHGLHTVTVAAGALSNGALLATTSIALGADHGLLQSELRDLASVNILEGDLVGVVDGASLWRATLLHSSTEHASKATTECGSASEELREQVLGIHTTSTSAAF